MDVSTASGVERVGAHGLDDAVVFRVDDHHISGQLSDDIRLAFVSVKAVSYTHLTLPTKLEV